MGDHWYKRDGTACHSIECKTKPGTYRSVTIKDARDLDLVPSVTTVLDIVHKYSLTEWKRRETLSWFLQQKPKPRKTKGESDEDYAKRMVAESDPYLKRAADWGTQIHDALERSLRKLLHDGTIDLEAEAGVAEWCFLDGPLGWFLDQGFREVDLEQSFATALGWGGRVDVVVGRTDIEYPTIIDWKTTKGYKGKLDPWPSYGVQLMAYAMGLGIRDPKLINVMIDSEKPGNFLVHEWPTESHGWLRRAWWNAFELWKSPLGKDYDPTGSEENPF